VLNVPLSRNSESFIMPRSDSNSEVSGKDFLESEAIECSCVPCLFGDGDCRYKGSESTCSWHTSTPSISPPPTPDISRCIRECSPTFVAPPRSVSPIPVIPPTPGMQPETSASKVRNGNGNKRQLVPEHAESEASALSPELEPVSDEEYEWTYDTIREVGSNYMRTSRATYYNNVRLPELRVTLTRIVPHNLSKTPKMKLNALVAPQKFYTECRIPDKPYNCSPS